MPEVMQRYKQTQIAENPDLANTFYYRTRILKGYSYRYHFCVNKQFVVDESKPVSKARFGQQTNWVQFQNEEENDTGETSLIKKPSYYKLDQTAEELKEQKMVRIISGASENEDIDQHLLHFDNVQDEIVAVQQLFREAQAMGDENTVTMVGFSLEQLRSDAQKIVEAVRIQVVGRLVRTKAIKDLYYEV